MSWNHRVLKQTYTHPNGEKEITYSIGEVYYDEEGNLKWYSDAALFGDTIEELGEVLDRMKNALFKKVIEVDGDSMKEVL